MKKYPNISVNIPLITNGDASIAFKHLRRVEYPKNRIEVIVVEGNQIAKQRNTALKHSKGTIIYLLDDDSRVRPQAFKILAREFSNPRVAAVGGPSLTYKSDGKYFNKLVGYILETYFGAMRMKFRYSQQSSETGNEYRLIGANLALRKSAVIKVGGFNEKIVPNEETELLRRLSKAGYKLNYNKNLFIRRENRKNMLKLIKQFHHYGIGRMKQMKNGFIKEDIVFLIVIGFYLYLITLIFFHPIWYLAPVFIYITGAGATSLKAAVKHHDLTLLLSMPLIFPFIHTSYVFGLIHELLFPINRLVNTKKSSSNITGITKVNL